MIKINPNTSATTPDPTMKPLADTRNFYELAPGERFKALIIDIKPGQVTIRLDDGGTFTARAWAPPEARIGEESLFTVRENNFKGQILLEMVKPDWEAKQGNMLKEALRNAGLFANDENLSLGKAILANNLPVDAATLQKAAFFKYANNDTSLAEVLFLLRENYPADIKSLENLRQILDNPMRLHNALEKLITSLGTADDPFPFSAETSFAAPESAEQEKGAALRKRLYLPLAGALKSGQASGMRPASPLNRYYNDLLKMMNTAETEITEPGIKHSAKEPLNEIRETLRFMENVHQHREYYQIPFIVPPHPQTHSAELYVFKDGAKKADLSKRASVLLALDTLSLGRVEVYARKEDSRVDFQFRCVNDETVRIFNGQTSRLIQALKQKGISVTGLTCQKSSESFNLLSPEPGTDPNNLKPETVPKRFAFDMRV